MSQEVENEQREVTLEDLAARLDVLGGQMNWVCENLQSLFAFMQQVGQNGGGLRGMMQALKQQQPSSTPIETQEAQPSD